MIEIFHVVEEKIPSQKFVFTYYKLAMRQFCEMKFVLALRSVRVEPICAVLA